MVSARGIRILVLGTLAAIAASTSAGAVGADGPTEYELKAVFLYNFTKYVTWPPGALDPDSPLTLCVLGNDPFGRVLDDTIRGETVQDHALATRRLARVEESGGCHLLFVSRSANGELPRVLDYVARAPVLTVGEVETFTGRGGMIALRNEDNRIRLEFNVEAAERAGLRLSSQLLKLGRVRSTGSE